MTVQELIDRLNNIVVIECIGNHKVYDANEIVGADIPKDDTYKEYKRGILISNV